MKRAALLLLVACAGSPPPAPTPVPTSPHVPVPVPVPALPLASAAHADPSTGALTLAGTPIDAPRLRIDPRGIRGELPKLGAVSPTAPFDLTAWSDAPKMRVLLAPPPAPSESLDAAARLVLVASDVGEGHFRAVEGDDDAYWDGAPAFDPRAVFAELAGVRTALRERWKLASSHAKYTFLFATPGERPVGRFHLDRVPGAMLLEVSAAEPWGTALRISLAAGLVQELLDGVRPASPPGEEWLAYGLPRAYARELLRRFGTLTARDVADDVNQTTTTLANAAAYLPAEQRALAGDRWGFELARALEGKGGLLALVDQLFLDARAGKATFARSELFARIEAKLGVPYAPPSTPAAPPFRAARTSCFDVVPEKRVVVVFPFAWESSRAAHRIAGASDGAPVKDGERIVELTVAGAAMKLTVLRDGAPVALAIAGNTQPALTVPKLVARADVSEAACREAP